MIFVTVGTQLPFDRLVGAVAAWARRHPEVRVFAQVGPGARRPEGLEHAEHLSPARVEELVRGAELVVAHAGMGSVLTALRARRPILVLPRRAALGEHRNEHQLATARWLATRPGVHVAWDEAELVRRLDDRGSLVAGAAIPEFAAATFTGRLAAAILA